MDQITSLLKTRWSGTEDVLVQFAFWAPLPPGFQTGFCHTSKDKYPTTLRFNLLNLENYNSSLRPGSHVTMSVNSFLSQH